MAIAFVGAGDLGNNGGASASLTAAFDYVATGNDLLLVACVGDATVDDITGATYHGVAMTQDKKQVTTGTDNRMLHLFRLLGSAAGSQNIVISAASTHYIVAVAACYSGVAQTGAPDATASNTGSGGTITTTLTSTVADNCWAFVGANGWNGGAGYTAGTNATRRMFDAATGSVALFDSNAAITPAQSFAMTVNNMSAFSTHSVMASYAPAGAGGSAIVPVVQRLARARRA